jgi:hypothetical protein
MFWASGSVQRIESLLHELWAPHTSLQALPEFQTDAGRDFNAAP